MRPSPRHTPNSVKLSLELYACMHACMPVHVSFSFFLLGLGPRGHVVTLRRLARPTTPSFYGVVGFGVVQNMAQNN